MRLASGFLIVLILTVGSSCATSGGSPDGETYQFRPHPRAGTTARGLGPPPERRIPTGVLPAGWPVAHAERRVISPYGVLRGRGRIHRGTDIKAPRGVPVIATAPGRVSYAGMMRGYGKFVVLDHGDNVETAYGHLDSIAVKVGEVVEYRQPLGRLGATGNATTHHVHYEVRIDGELVDPTPYISPRDI